MKTFNITLLFLIVLVGCSQQTIAPNKTPSLPVAQTESQNVPTAEETQAITAIRSFSEKKPLSKNYQLIQHVGHEPNPNIDVMLEKYDADGDVYLLQGTAISLFMSKSIVPADPQNITKDPPMGPKIYTPQELEAMAKEFLKNTTPVDFTKLTPNFGTKGDNYFFSLENRKNGKNSEGVYPDVRVGIRKDGWLFSYENILND